MMTEFGHFWCVVPGAAIDCWGAGPFVIVADKEYRFEDSDRFGPSLVKKNGDICANPFPPERSPFWNAHAFWVHQGRRMADDGVTCVWTRPKPAIMVRRGRSLETVEDGDSFPVWMDDFQIMTPKEYAAYKATIPEDGGA